MADTDSGPTTFGSRNASFVAGRFGPSESSGLSQDQGKEQSLTPQGYRASGVNQQMAPSGNGSSAADAQRMTYGGAYVPSSNGMSANTYEQKRPMLSTSLSV